MKPGKSFEEIYQQFCVKEIEPWIEKLKNVKRVVPPESEQLKIIEEALRQNCSYRLIAEVNNANIKPLRASDELYPFFGEISVETFCKNIHIKFLPVYLIYAKIGLDMAVSSGLSATAILTRRYQTILPLKLKNDTQYNWYTQTAIPLTLSERNEVMSHINIYSIVKPLLEEDENPENFFIEAFALNGNHFDPEMAKEIKRRIGQYYKDNVFKNRHIRRLFEENRLINEVGETIDENGRLIDVDARQRREKSPEQKKADNTRWDLNKQIIALLHEYSGYGFKTVKHVVLHLRKLYFFPKEDDR
jgi:hypothetical protein